ncbi:MAG TPA: Gfo/Idh/MocA family oxidoreductase [Pseudothermotoga sp.]|nr:Gfo/Idh/MocA family oxidoreductase [Pseudothermotoga sp.]HOK84566.1 Gfo/Idh/MocA family oxidoreductase [Pseudothermotoga sp.]HPP69426.1 Gfo/Idh/MocA family oxidoreductase [Pseudothermotoga sp.]
MKICIIGSSGHFHYALRGFKSNWKIVAIAPGSKGEDVTPLKKALSEMNITPNEYKSYQEMLDREKPDVVVVNTVFNANSRILCESLSRRIHTFVEKPIATSFEELEKIKKLFGTVKNEVFFAAMFGLRYKPHFLTAKALLDGGEIGQIRLLNTQKSYKLGKRPEFYRRRDTYGGTILWVGIHAIDWINWFTQKGFLNVYATHSRISNNGHGELESTALCHFVLEQEIFASISIDYLRPNAAPTHDDDRVRIVGTRGIIEVFENRVLLLNDKGENYIPLLPEKQIFSEFLSQIDGTGSCMVTPYDSILATEIALLARESADTGRVIQVCQNH